jgi:hypothetical protein
MDGYGLAQGRCRRPATSLRRLSITWSRSQRRVELLPGREAGQAVRHLLQELARLLHAAAGGLRVAGRAGGVGLAGAVDRPLEGRLDLRSELTEAGRLADPVGEEVEAAEERVERPRVDVVAALRGRQRAGRGRPRANSEVVGVASVVVVVVSARSGSWAASSGGERRRRRGGRSGGRRVV